MKKGKRVLGIVLTVLMILQMIPATAFAADSTSENQSYAAIGDSVCIGFYIDGKSRATNISTHYENSNEGCYTRLVGKALSHGSSKGEEGYVNAYNLGCAGINSQTMNDLLRGKSFKAQYDKKADYPAKYRETMAKADLVTFNIGANDAEDYVLEGLERWSEEVKASGEENPTIDMIVGFCNGMFGGESYENIIGGLNSEDADAELSADNDLSDLLDGQTLDDLGITLPELISTIFEMKSRIPGWVDEAFVFFETYYEDSVKVLLGKANDVNYSKGVKIKDGANLALLGNFNPYSMANYRTMALNKIQEAGGLESLLGMDTSQVIALLLELFGGSTEVKVAEEEISALMEDADNVELMADIEAASVMEKMILPLMTIMIGNEMDEFIDDINEVTEQVADKYGLSFIDISKTPSSNCLDPHPDYDGHAYIAEQILADVEATVTASAGSNGKVAPAGAKDYTIGSMPEYSIKADKGYKIESIKVDGEDVRFDVTKNYTDYTYILPSLLRDHLVEASFVTEGTEIEIPYDSHKLTVDGNAKDALNIASDSKVYEFIDYSFTISKSNDYNYRLSVKMDGKDITKQVVESNNEYTIPGDIIEGDIVVTLNKISKDSIVTGKTFKKVDAPESGKQYVIVATDNNSGDTYAINSVPHDGYSNKAGYSYYGFEGTPVTLSSSKIKSDVTKDMVWTVTTSDGGYLIRNYNNEYLSSVYKSTNGTSDMSNGGFIRLGTTKEVWTLGSDGKLIGKDSKRYLTFDANIDDHTADSNNEIKTGTGDLFTIRSEGSADKISFYEVADDADGDSYPVYLAFSADVHNQDGSMSNTEVLNNWINSVSSKLECEFDVMGFCGDYASGSGNLNKTQYWDATQKVMDVVLNNDNVANAVFTTGNHEMDYGAYTGTETTAPQKNITRLGEAANEKEYRVYCLGASSDSQTTGYSQSDITALDTYLNSVSETVPVFVLAHFPLHKYGDRDTGNKQKVIDVLNEHKNVIFLWGHNHTDNDTHYDSIYTGSLDGTKINFTYASAGFMGINYNYPKTKNMKGLGLVAEINNDYTVTLAYYDSSYNRLAETTVTYYGGNTPAADYAVTVSGSGASDVTAAAKADVNKNFDFTVNKAEGYDYEVKVTAGGKEVSVANNGNSYSIKAADITGKIEISVNKTKHVDVVTDKTFTKAGSIESGKQYVIVAKDSDGNFGINSNEHTGYTNDQSFSYSGLCGTAVTISENKIISNVTADMIWTVTSSGDGYTLKNCDNRYLVSFYQNSTSPKGGYIKLGTDAEVWTFSNNNLKGATSGKLLNYDGKADHASKDTIESGQAELFTVRSSGDSIEFYLVADKQGEPQQKEFDVTVSGSGASDVTAAAKATEKTAYSFTVDKKSGYNYEIVVKVLGTPILPSNSGNTYTIPASSVTGAVEITVTKEQIPATEYTVTVNGSGKTDVTAAAKAAEKTDYSFTLNKAAGYNYTVTVKVGGKTVTPALSGNAYIIPAASVTGALEITVTKELISPTEYTVTVTGTGAADVTAPAAVTSGSNLSFGLTKETGFTYIVKVYVNGTDMTAQLVSGGNQYTLAALSINGNVEIAVSKADNNPVVPAEYSVSVSGSGASDVTAAAKATEKTDYRFTVNKKSDYTYSVTVKVANKAVTPTLSGNTYTVPAASVTGNIDIIVTRNSNGTGGGGGSTGGGGGGSGGGGGGFAVASEFTLSFNTNGGTSVSDYSAKSGTKVDLGSYTTTKKGYSFDGWYLDSALTTPAEDVTLNKNTTVYAKWKLFEFPKSGNYSGYTDVDESMWYGIYNKGVIREVTLLGIMSGDGNGSFRPADNIRLSEVIKMASVVNNIYNGSTYTFKNAKGSDWYKEYVEYAIANNIISQNEFSDYTKFATRGEMAYIFAKAVPAEYLTKISSKSAPDVTSATKYAEQIQLLYSAGVLEGSDSAGTFNSDTNINRAEAAAIISRIALPSTRIAAN